MESGLEKLPPRLLGKNRMGHIGAHRLGPGLRQRPAALQQRAPAHGKIVDNHHMPALRVPFPDADPAFPAFAGLVADDQRKFIKPAAEAFQSAFVRERHGRMI